MNTSESETCILGAILMNPDVLKTTKTELEPSDFSNEKNELIYRAMLDLESRGDPIIPTSIINMLGKDAEKAGGGQYVGEILKNVITSAGTAWHIKQVRSNRIKFQLMTISDVIAKTAPHGIPQEVLQKTKTSISSIRSIDAAQTTHDLCDILPDVYASLEHRDAKNLPTGLTALDNLIIGWSPGDFIILAGRPGMGKSILGKEFAESANVPVLFFSLEMPRDQLVKRQLAAHSGVNYTSIRRSYLRADDMDRIKQAAKKLSRIPIAYSDKANMSISEISATCEVYRKQHDLGLVIIDYLQLIRAEGRLEHREREVSQISQRLKVMARDLDIPVICLAQLNRSCELRGGDKRPMLSDLRESGSLEQDADIVIFIWREVVYKSRTSEDGTNNKHKAELIVAKGRNTDIGCVEVYFDGAHQLIKNLDYTQQE